jgi:transcriptional regulator with XRE-family HTH domain
MPDRPVTDAPDDDGTTPEIGRRLRQARRARWLSLDETAKRSQLSKGFLSQVERDLAAPSVAALLRLCATLEIPMGDLFGAAQHPLVRAGEQTPVTFGGRDVEEFQLTPAGESRLLVLQSDIAPGGGSGDDPYQLAAEAEFVHVLQGGLEITVDGTRHQLAAGDSLTFDPRTPHRWQNPSRIRPARVLWVLTPALR